MKLPSVIANRESAEALPAGRQESPSRGLPRHSVPRNDMTFYVGALLVLIFFFTGVIYLSLPTPALPDLRDSGLSDEPGDTWQHPDQKGYYSNLTRAEVLSDIQSKSLLTFLGRTIFPYRLNYPPEDAQTLVRDQINTYYLEEIVYPFRNSIFINGWEPKKSTKYLKTSEISTSDLYLHGVPYDAKITIRPVDSPIWARLFIWTLLFPTTYLVLLSFRKTLKDD